MKDEDIIINEKKMADEDEISLIDLVRTLWAERKTFIITVIIFTFLGLLVALFSEEEYKASTMMVPQIENQQSRLGGLSSLASLAGFDMNLNTGANVLSPMLYPSIISSTKFQLEVMNAEYQFDELESPTSLYDYYVNHYKPGIFGILKKYTFGLPGLIRSALQEEQADSLSNSESEIIMLTQDQYEVGLIIEDNLSLTVNDNDGYLTLVMRSQQAFLSAQIVKKSQELLQEYVTRYKVEKAAAQLEFIRERYEENKSEFEEAQSRLAAFRDANKNITSEIMRTHEERLQNEYQLAFDVYSELAKQLEQSLIKVEEQTPLFSIIKEVIVPIERSKPKRVLILSVWFILGILSGTFIIFGRIFYNNLKIKWQALSKE